MARSGRFDDPRKSAYAYERFDSDWERQYMEMLEADPLVRRWTKRHGLEIPYLGTDGRTHRFRPDYLVELVDGNRQLREVKGTHLLKTPETLLKFEAAEAWCAKHNLQFIVVGKD